MKVLLQFCYFIFYSMVGWACETIFCSIKDKRFVNRGFLNGPFCPIYGVGGILVVGLFSRYSDDIPALFIMSTVITGVVEYISGFLLEKLFHLSLWDYSDVKFNINGRVCVPFLACFGAMSVAAVEWIHPAVVRFFDMWPDPLLIIVTCVMTAYFIFDLAVTVTALVKMERDAGSRQLELDELARLRDEVKEHMRDEQRERAAEQRSRLEELRAKSEELAAKLEQKLHGMRLNERRLIAAFPKLRSVRYPQAVEELKAALAARISERRERKNRREK